MYVPSIVSIYYIHGIIDKWQLSWQCYNLIFISHASKSTVSFSVTSVTSHMKSLMSHRLHFTASDIPLQSFSDFRKVSRSPIIRSIRLLAAHATVASRHLYITSWAHCAQCAVCAVSYFYPRRFAVNAIMWLPNPKPKTGFGLSQNRKTGFTKGTRFWKPYL